jgi:hypothetical protein
LLLYHRHYIHHVVFFCSFLFLSCFSFVQLLLQFAIPVLVALHSDHHPIRSHIHFLHPLLIERSFRTFDIDSRVYHLNLTFVVPI